MNLNFDSLKLDSILQLQQKAPDIRMPMRFSSDVSTFLKPLRIFMTWATDCYRRTMWPGPSVTRKSNENKVQLTWIELTYVLQILHFSWVNDVFKTEEHQQELNNFHFRKNIAIFNTIFLWWVRFNLSGVLENCAWSLLMLYLLIPVL